MDLPLQTCKVESYFRGPTYAIHILSKPPPPCDDIPLVFVGSGRTVFIFRLDTGVLLHSFSLSCPLTESFTSIKGFTIVAQSNAVEEKFALVVYGQKVVSYVQLDFEKIVSLDSSDPCSDSDSDSETFEIRFSDRVVWALSFRDWVLDVSTFLNPNQDRDRESEGEQVLILIGFVHNVVELWQFSADSDSDSDSESLNPHPTRISSLPSPRRCAFLFDLKLFYVEEDRMILVASTVTYEIELWAVPLDVVLGCRNQEEEEEEEGEGGDGKDTDVIVRRLSGHQGLVYRMCWAFGGTCIASASEDRFLKVWKVGAWWKAPNFDVESIDLVGHLSRPWDVKIVENLDDPMVVSCGQDGTVRIWDFADGSSRQVFRGHNQRNVWRVAVGQTPEGCVVGSVADDGGAKLWYLDLCCPKTRSVEVPEGDQILRMALAQNGVIYAVLLSGELCRFGPEEDAKLEVIGSVPLQDIRTNRVKELAVSRDSSLVYAVDAKYGQCFVLKCSLAEDSTSYGAVTASSFQPFDAGGVFGVTALQNCLVAVFSLGQPILSLYDCAGAECPVRLCSFPSVGGRFKCLAVSSDQKFIVAGDSKGNAMVFRVADGALVCNRRFHRRQITGLVQIGSSGADTLRFVAATSDGRASLLGYSRDTSELELLHYMRISTVVPQPHGIWNSERYGLVFMGFDANRFVSYSWTGFYRMVQSNTRCRARGCCFGFDPETGRSTYLLAPHGKGLLETSWDYRSKPVSLLDSISHRQMYSVRPLLLEDDTFVVCAGEDRILLIFSFPELNPVWHVEMKNSIKALDVSVLAGEVFLVTGGGKEELSVYRMRQTENQVWGRELFSRELSEKSSSENAVDYRILSLVVQPHPNGSDLIIFTGASCARIDVRRFTPEDGSMTSIHRLSFHEGIVSSLACSLESDSIVLLSASSDATVKKTVFRLDDLSCGDSTTIAELTHGVRGVSVFPESNCHIACCGDDQSVYLTGTGHIMEGVHASGVSSVCCFSPLEFVTASYDQRICVFSIRDEKVVLVQSTLSCVSHIKSVSFVHHGESSYFLISGNGVEVLKYEVQSFE